MSCSLVETRNIWIVASTSAANAASQFLRFRSCVCCVLQTRFWVPAVPSSPFWRMNWVYFPFLYNPAVPSRVLPQHWGNTPSCLNQVFLLIKLLPSVSWTALWLSHRPVTGTKRHLPPLGKARVGSCLLYIYELCKLKCSLTQSSAGVTSRGDAAHICCQVKLDRKDLASSSRNH